MGARIGRPRKPVESRVTLPRITIAMDPPALDRLDRAADRADLARSEIVRRALDEYLTNHPDLAAPKDQESLVA